MSKRTEKKQGSQCCIDDSKSERYYKENVLQLLNVQIHAGERDSLQLSDIHLNILSSSCHVASAARLVHYTFCFM